MMASSKPIILFFPGAFHTTNAFMPVKTILEEKSYSCILSPNAPSLRNSDFTGVDLDTDVSYFRESVILPLLDDGKELVLVMHSYAGASAGGAVQGLSISERQAAGQKGGICGLICISAICLPAGFSIQEMLQMTDELAPWTIVDPEKSKVSSLGTFKAKARYSPYTDEAWKGKLAYLLCEDDQTFPVQLQQLFVQSGFFDIVESLPGSHSTFLDMPEKTADVIIKFIVAFGKEGGSS
ncbi:hypothetical protein EYC84_000584 [Monilinia fructicola]|uniref:AB hydrolase-1 domain-containing protein n=1 Tax=Monilinia fructicola TaxID=38448 RepID=A0A5M9JP27_MONFR|nr:hypothetical protein EYC84_000584 [Monilinia fructicola]